MRCISDADFPFKLNITSTYWSMVQLRSSDVRTHVQNISTVTRSSEDKFPKLLPQKELGEIASSRRFIWREARHVSYSGWRRSDLGIVPIRQSAESFGLTESTLKFSSSRSGGRKFDPQFDCDSKFQIWKTMPL